MSSIPPPGADNSGVRPLPAGTIPAAPGVPSSLEEALRNASRASSVPPPLPRPARARGADRPVSVDWPDAATYRAADPNRRRVDSPLKAAVVRAAEGPDAVPKPERRQPRSSRPTPRSMPPAGGPRHQARAGSDERPLIPGLRAPRPVDPGARAARTSVVTPRAFPRRSDPAMQAAGRNSVPVGDLAGDGRPRLSGDAPWQKGETALIPMADLEARGFSLPGDEAELHQARLSWQALAGLSLLVVALGVGAALWLRAQGVTLPRFDLQALIPPSSPPPAVAASSSTVIDSLPKGAELHVDGVVIGNTPLTVLRGDRPVTYTLRLPGYHTQALQVGPNSGSAIRIALSPVTPATAP